MSGSSRVVLDSDDEDALDEGLDLSAQVQAVPDASSGPLPDTISKDVTSSNLHQHMDDAHNALLLGDTPSMKRAASAMSDAERGRLKRPKAVPEVQAHRHYDDPYDGSQSRSQEQPTESQLKQVYHEVIAEPSSTVMDSATPRLVHGEDHVTNAPADAHFGTGDITFHEGESEAVMTPTKSYMTPMTSTSHQTSWNHNTMSVPVVLLPGPGRGYTGSSKARQHRETSPDELSADPLIDMPKEMYRPRPSRSRSLRVDSEAAKQVPDDEDASPRPKKRRRRASAGATMRAQQDSLVSMGFRPSQAERALQVTDGNLDRAIDWLCPENSKQQKDATVDVNAPEEHVQPDVKCDSSGTISVVSQPVEPEREPEPELETEPEPGPSTKKRKAAANKKTPAKKKQRKRAVAKPVYVHDQQVAADDTAAMQADEAVIPDNTEEPEPLHQTRGQDQKLAAAAIEAEDHNEDELAEVDPAKTMFEQTPTEDKEEDDDAPIREAAPIKAGKRGRGRPKKTSVPLEVSVEVCVEDSVEQDKEEPTDDTERQVEEAVLEAGAEVDAHAKTTEDKRDSGNVLAEKDVNVSIAEAKADVQGNGSKPETPATKPKQALGNENLVRATPPLKLSNGPVHRVGLSKRRPIQSLLRIIKR